MRVQEPGLQSGLRRRGQGHPLPLLPPLGLALLASINPGTSACPVGSPPQASEMNPSGPNRSAQTTEHMVPQRPPPQL